MNAKFVTIILNLILFSIILHASVLASVIVVGHKNPDTDAVVAAIAVAELKSRLATPATAYVQGEIMPETKYLLDLYGVQVPEKIQSVANQKVILVDHADTTQSPDDLSKAELVGIIDHHRLGGIITGAPIEVRMLPVGSTATIIRKMYAESQLDISKTLAALMVGAIITDTVVFKSPTTTPEDKLAATQLAAIAGIQDLTQFGMKLFEIKSDIGSKSGNELLNRDLKTFEMNGKKIAVAQLELMSLSDIRKKRDELLLSMKTLKNEQNYHSVFLMLTDIMIEGTELLYLSDEANIIEKAFSLTSQDNVSCWLAGTVSRKKQIIPFLDRAFKSKSPRI